jgi:hypothetical protein
LITALLEERYGAGLTFELSRYVYLPQALKEKRVSFLVPASLLSSSHLGQLLGELGDDEELAFHSNVRLPNGEIMHIPMLDFSGKHIINDWDVIESTLTESIRFRSVLDTFRLFDSGRSFHGYSLHLLSAQEWVLYMGALLLMNLPTGRKVVDSRWVGHRLLSGYSSLRWSCNTPHYKKMPHLINHRNLVNRRLASAEEFLLTAKVKSS